MSVWPEGCGRHLLAETDSTNAEAARMAAAGHAAPFWVMARRQSAGRGRQGRAWSSPEGNLCASNLTAFAGSPAEAASRFAQAAGLAAAETCEAFLPGIPTALKWPNDVLIEGRKAGGILIENLGPGGDGRLRVVTGIGLNLAHHPDPAETRWPPTSLAAEGGGADPEAALGVLAERFAHWTGLGRAALAAAWRGRLTGIGQRIEARLQNETLTGTFETVDEDGTLVLNTPTGQRRIAAADVYFPE